MGGFLHAILISRMKGVTKVRKILARWNATLEVICVALFLISRSNQIIIRSLWKWYFSSIFLIVCTRHETFYRSIMIRAGPVLLHSLLLYYPCLATVTQVTAPPGWPVVYMPKLCGNSFKCQQHTAYSSIDNCISVSFKNVGKKTSARDHFKETCTERNMESSIISSLSVMQIFLL